MGNELTSSSLAEGIVDYFAMIQPVLFKDISPERRAVLIDRISGFIVASADLGLARMLKDDEDSLRLKEDVLNATLVSILSQLGIAKEQMKDTVIRAGVRVFGQLAGVIAKSAMGG